MNYYVNTILYNLTVVMLPCLFILVIWITGIGIFITTKKIKVNVVHLMLVILLDIALGMATYRLILYELDKGMINLLTNLFINIEGRSMANNYILLAFILGLSFLIIYIFGIDMYLKALKANIFNTSNKLVSNSEINFNEYKVKGTIYSIILRDIKIINRTSALKFNCITVNIGFSVLFVIGVIALRDYAVLLRDFIGVKPFLIAMILLTLMMGNLTLGTPFSRDGKFTNVMKSFPISRNQIIWAKIIVSLISNIPAFIAINIFVLLISSNIVDLIVYEIFIIIYIIFMSIIYMAKDIKNINIKWKDIKDLFGIETTFKLMGKYFIITMLFILYIVMAKFMDILQYELLTIAVYILIGLPHVYIGLKTIFKSKIEV